MLLAAVSQLNTQPAESHVNASRLASRTDLVRHAGTGRLARPYLVGDLHLLSFCQISQAHSQMVRRECAAAYL